MDPFSQPCTAHSASEWMSRLNTGDSLGSRSDVGAAAAGSSDPSVAVDDLTLSIDYSVNKQDMYMWWKQTWNFLILPPTR